MRVAHVITRLIVGGAQENTIASVLGLRARADVQATLISGPTTGPEGSLESLVREVPGTLTLVPQLVRPIHPWYDLLALVKLTGLLRGSGPEIVHTHSGKAGFLGRLAARRARIPVVVHTIHGPSFGAFQRPLANRIFTSAERIAGRLTTHFVSVADAMTEQYLQAGIGRPEQYSTIRSGFALGPFLSATNDLKFRHQFGLGPDDFVVGMIGRLFKLKGHDDLFAAAPRLLEEHPRIRFLLVGDGPWRRRFEQMASSDGLSGRFVFAGLVAPEDVARYVGIMDVAVHLSLREGLPRVLPQALAAGKPVVAYDCDGAREVCLDGETGFLVKPGHVSGLVSRILQLAREPGLRERFGQAGRELARESFPVERMIDQLHTLYRRLLSEHSIGGRS